MPCSYYTPDEEVAISRRELDRVTRVACELAKFAIRYKSGFSRETLKWMADHAAMDRRRLADETRNRERNLRKQKALNKLTRAERKALEL